jgi:6-phosphogluconate dehydrogenase (decarboxylating)
MPCIGLVGVGLLGSAVAARLLQHGFEVIGYDTRVTQLEALRPQGLRAAGSVVEAAAGYRRRNTRERGRIKRFPIYIAPQDGVM